MIQLVLKGKPLSTQHCYGQRGRIRYMKQEAKDLKEDYIYQIRKQYMGGVITKNIEIWIDLYFADNRRRDWDNYHKISMDALEDRVIKNDSQIKVAHVSMKKGEEPRIELRIKIL